MTLRVVAGAGEVISSSGIGIKGGANAGVRLGHGMDGGSSFESADRADSRVSNVTVAGLAMSNRVARSDEKPAIAIR